MKINAISLGKKPLSFLDYEAVITPGKQANSLSSVNILFQGRILVKIKVDITLDQTNLTNIEKLIKQTITDYINGKETGLGGNVSTHTNPAAKTTKKQAKAKEKAANDLFTMFNL